MGDDPGREEAPLGVRRGESGQGLIEYALIIFLVAIVVIAILLLLGPQIGAVFSSIYATI
jgi:pilus assembly protein Flp/PilA